MPKIAGVNVLGVLLAAVAMFFIGFIWYGLLFTEPWMAANGLFFYRCDQIRDAVANR